MASAARLTKHEASHAATLVHVVYHVGNFDLWVLRQHIDSGVIATIVSIHPVVLVTFSCLNGLTSWAELWLTDFPTLE